MTSGHELLDSAGEVDPPQSDITTAEPTSTPRAGMFLVLLGCALVALSLVIPVMRWQASAVHDTAGSAMVFLGDGWTLADGGYPGWPLVPISLVALCVLVIATLSRSVNNTRRRVQLTSAAVLAYYPIWVLMVFVRKLEDKVYPAEGAAALVVGAGAIAAGLWRGRTR